MGELRALARLAAAELGGAVSGVEAVHRAIARRAAAGPVHDAIAGGVYAAVRGGTRLAGRVADGALALAEPGPALSDSPRGAAALGALNGLIGDRLEGDELEQAMSVRSAIGPLEGHVVVFVHGLFETEHAWGFGGGPTYGARLARDLGCTALFVRYNTGRRVSANGRSLAELLESLPEAVTRITLVGHSMGGLVARSACHAGGSWTGRVRHVVSLGSPHRGAPLEEAVHLAGAALAAVPETRPFAGLLRRRSGGIRDMRRGSLVDADWVGRDPDALRAVACEEVPLLDGAVHCFVAASVTQHPVGRLIGDWLVLSGSATHRAQETLHVTGAHHLALLNDPRVYARLRDWLAG